MHCSYPLPTQEQAFEAGRNLFRALSGREEADLACKLHCAGALAMFGLTMLPHEHEAAASTGDTEERLKQELARFDDEKAAAEEEAIPWGLIATLALEMFLKWVKSR